MWFECNMTRDQAVAEAIRLLRLLGISASSPDVSLPREVEAVEEEDEVEEPGELVEELDDDEDEVEPVGGLGLVIRGGEGEAQGG